MSPTRASALDAVVIGSGPNGLAAAIAIAQAGHSVRVYEAQDTAGGSTRSASLTLPGFAHDIGAAVHALALVSPFLKSLPLTQHGFEAVHPSAPFAHPLDDGTAGIIERSVDATADGFVRHDAIAYRKLMLPFTDRADDLMRALLAPLGIRSPLLMARFGIDAIQPADRFVHHTFETERVRALFAGVAAHSMLRFEQLATSGYALGLIIAAHAVGWPVARGGSQQLANAMVSYLRSLGGEVVTGAPVRSLDDLPPSRAVLCDITPRQFLEIAKGKLPGLYRWRMSRFRYGPGVFKMDWALNAAVPWRAAECRRAGTIHVGGSFDDIAQAEHLVTSGGHPEQPYVLVVQPSTFDDTRAPSGKHTLWAYCHVPNGSTVDMTVRIENQIERFAPGFRDCIEARSVMYPADLERDNANIVGGDIGGGSADLAQFYSRPIAALNPYKTPIDGVYLCSSSTPPGVGVHGMCGYYAAQHALKYLAK